MEKVMGLIVVASYVVAGLTLALWIGFAGPVKPDNMQKAGALACIALLWPLFLPRTLR
jgi:hypothetical protein